MKKSIYTKLAVAALALPLLGGVGGGLFAQIFNASTITIQSGANLYFDGSTQNQSGGTLSNSGTVHVSGNFTNSGTANIGGTIVFDGSSAQSITGNNDFLNHIEVDNIGGTVIMASGQHNVHQYMKITNGTLDANNHVNFLSTSTQTALIDGSGDGNVQGLVTFNRYIAGGNGYRYFSAPVAGATVGSVSDDFGVVGADGHPSQAYTNPWPTLWRYDETNTNTDFKYGWISNTAAGNNLNPTTGYAGIMAATTLDFTGSVANGTISKFITKSGTNLADGWNLVGNPYPSPIDWVEVYNLNSNLAATYYAWSSTGTYTGQYATYNALSGLQVNGGSRDIASSQGFFIKATSTGNLILNNTLRTTLLNPQFYKQSYDEITAIRLSVHGKGHGDELLIYEELDGEQGYSDKYDALKMKAEDNSLPSFYSLAVDQSPLAINALPKLDDRIIPLGFKAGQHGIYVISAVEIMALRPGKQVILEDKKLNIYHNLAIDNYEFVQNPDDPEQGRFFLRIDDKKELNVNSPSIVVNLFSNSGTVFIQVKGNIAKHLPYTITNVSGQLVTKGVCSLNQSEGQIVINELTSSLYFASFEIDSKLYCYKLIVE